jgi:uncharacterized OsmC-like protein
MLNTINISGLSEFSNEVLENRKEGVAKYGIELNWKSGTFMDVNTLPMVLGENKLVRNFSFNIDEPSQLGGTNKAPNPQEYLLAGVAGCIAVTFIAGATTNKIALDSFSLQLKGDLDLSTFLGLSNDNHPGFQELELEIKVKGDGTKQQYLELLEKVKKHSPNFSNMVNKVSIKPTLKIED